MRDAGGVGSSGAVTVANWRPQAESAKDALPVLWPLAVEEVGPLLKGRQK